MSDSNTPNKITQLILNGVTHDIQDAATSQALTQETKNREDADKALEEVDNELQSQINKEIGDREEEDHILQTQINGITGSSHNYPYNLIALAKKDTYNHIIGDARKKNNEYINGLMSAEDKEYIDKLKNLTEEEGENSIVDTLEEALAVLKDYSETANIADDINGLKDKNVDLQEQITTEQGRITTETSNREAADADLQSQIETEREKRENTDTNLQNKIDAEATTRDTADKSLDKKIDAEAATRKTQDDNIYSQLGEKTPTDKTDSAWLQTIHGRLNSLEEHKADIESTEISYHGTLEEFLDDFANIKLTNGNYISQNDLSTNFLRNKDEHTEFILKEHHLVPGVEHKIILADNQVIETFSLQDGTPEGEYIIYFRPTGGDSNVNVVGNSKIWISPITKNTKRRSTPSETVCLRGIIQGIDNWNSNDIKMFQKEEDVNQHMFMGQLLTWGDKFKVHIIDTNEWYGYDSLDNPSVLVETDSDRNIVIKKPGRYDVYFNTSTKKIGIDTSYFSPYYMDEVSSPFRATITADKAFVFDALSGISIYSFDEGSNRTI